MRGEDINHKLVRGGADDVSCTLFETVWPEILGPRELLKREDVH